MRKLIEKIENYLSSNAEPGPLQKGERIAQTIDNFGTPSIDIENDVATFRIMGTIFYTVVVSDISGALRTKCSCPYDWGGICKHQVGALLYLKDYLQKNQNLSSRVRLTRTAPVRKLKQRRSGENYLLQDYHNMSYNWLNGLINFYEMKRAHSFSLSDLVVTNELVRCVVEENKRNYWQPNKQQIVQFRETADGLQTSCSCDQLVEKLCVHQVAALSEIIHRYGEDFFIVLDPDYMNSARNSMSKRSGIPLDQLDDYFRFDFKHRKFVPREKASGLLSFNEDNQQLARKLIGNLVAEEKFTLPSWSKDSDKAQRMGYVFTFHEPTAFRLTPITGTPQDEFWMKYIEEYDNRRPPAQLDAEDEAILSALAELKIFQDRYDKNYAPSDDEKLNAQKFYHKTLQKIFPLLQQRAYLYLRFDGQAQNKIKKSQLTPIQLSPDVVSLFFELVEEDIFYSLQAKLKIGEQIVDLADPQLDVRSLLPFYSLVYWKENLYLHPTLQQAETLFRLVRQNRVFKVIKKDFRPFFEQIVTPLSAHFPIDTSGMKELKQLTVQLSPQSKNIYLSELGNFILFKPVVSYDHDQSVNPKLDNKLIVHQDNTIVTFEREATYEQQFLETMEAIHPAFAEQRYQEFFFLPFTELSRNGWFFKIFDSFNEAGIEVFGINDLKTIQYSPFKANVNTHIKSGLDWFDVSIELSFGEENVKLNDVRKAIMRNERFVKLSNGKLGILPEEWFDKLSKFFRVGEIEKGQLKISKLKFTIVDELFEQIDDAEVMEELLEKKRRLTNFQNIKEVSLPANITATLRDYQVAGFHWLNFLNEFKWGGILADDMGLGKTLQILTFLQDQCNKSGLPNLVVVPTTLLFNWENEIKKFAPELEYLIHHGSDRTSRHSKFRDYNIIITTYGLVVNDAELFSR
ncbi:MAG: SNF2-related protein, partial [Bacteroidota bacterium]